MSCGFNLGCHIHALVAPFWFWLQIGFWVVVALVALWALAKLKAIGGWPAVVAGVGALAGGAGYAFGRSRVKVARRGGKPQQLTREQLKAVQRALAAKNLYPGEIDGKFGEKSQAGMKAFQRQRDEPMTGFPTYNQLLALGVNIPIE